MQNADEPIRAAVDSGGRANGLLSGSISIALLATVALVPIIVAAGFLSDRGAARAAIPDDIAAVRLRGVLDGGPGQRPDSPARAGY